MCKPASFESLLQIMSQSTKAMPNFFVVGAPKAGTTSLYRYLRQHPQIYMSPIKEPNYFAAEVRPENFSEEFQQRVSQDMRALQEYLRTPMSEWRFGGMVLEWEDYLRLFQNVKEEKAVGEASVCYLWSKTAAQGMFSNIPDSKIIMILRDPAERAFSQYLHTVASGLVRESFREQIQATLRRKSQKFGTLYPFLEFGLYYEQVKRYLELFPGEKVRIYLFEDYRKHPGQLLIDIFRFLNVDASFLPNTSQKHLEPQIPQSVAISYALKKYGIWQTIKELTPQALRPLFRTLAFKQRTSLLMDSRDRAYLVDYYRQDTLNLSRLLDRDLTGWLH